MRFTGIKFSSVRATGVRFDLSDRQGLILCAGAAGTMAWTMDYRIAGAGSAKNGLVARLARPRQRRSPGAPEKVRFGLLPLLQSVLQTHSPIYCQ